MLLRESPHVVVVVVVSRREGRVGGRGMGRGGVVLSAALVVVVTMQLLNFQRMMG